MPSRLTPDLRLAKARLDRLDLYDAPVEIDGVRVKVTPWFFRVFRGFDGCALPNLILLKKADSSLDLLTHELCHVWQFQQCGYWASRFSYFKFGYWDNPWEVEARHAVAFTRTKGPNELY